MDLKATGIAVTIVGSALCEEYTTGSSKYVIGMILSHCCRYCDDSHSMEKEITF